MDKVDGQQISGHLQEITAMLIEAVILAETGESEAIRTAATIQASMLGSHLFDDFDKFGTLAAHAINATNEDNMVEELMSDISDL